MKISRKQLLAFAVGLTVCAQSSFAQSAKLVGIDSTAASFKNADSIAARKAVVLNGLTNLATATPEFKKAFNEAAADKNYKMTDQKYYTAEFINVPFEEYRKLLFDASGTWVDDMYGDINYSKKAFVLRRATPEEQEKKVATLKGYYSAKKGTPIAQNDVEVSKLVGAPAPDFTVTTIDGKKVSIKSLKGKVVVLNFWFTQCPPCREEMPTLNTFVDKYKGNKDVVFLAPEVVPATTVADVQKFLKRVPFTYQVALGGKDAAALYQVKVFPANFVIDKKGIVRMGYVGYNPYSLQELGKTIPKLIAE
ncbi:TlpA disulfide reductase family protein [Chitinophagaceae bacterium 26-R-25]|nr:TlpA disulfide reductase family protein [Chitinophagaceae bacterium 26-R-25]